MIKAILSYQEHGIIFIVAAIVLFYPTLFIAKKFVTYAFKNFIHDKEKDFYTKSIEKHKIVKNLKHNFLSIYLFFCADLVVLLIKKIPHLIIRIQDILLVTYSTIFFAATILSTINIFLDIYHHHDKSKKIPIAMHLYVIKILVICCAILIVISELLDLPISGIFASLGAFAAILTLIFKDMVFGFVASMQLILSDLMRIGDWVTIPKYDVDGNVELMTITSVKIRNFNQTVTIIPTASLLTTPIINWRANQESGGHRIRKEINIDMDTIIFYTKKQIDQLKDLEFMSLIKKNHPKLLDPKLKITNLAFFRHYLNHYLEDYKIKHEKSFNFIMRQNAPTDKGLPIEICIFVQKTDWTIYEELQSEIFEYTLAMLPKFDLRAFQSIHQRQ